jgi:hypothetical protein
VLPDSSVTQESRYSQNLSETMGAFSLALAGCSCLGLAAYRMMWGDDNGNAGARPSHSLSQGLVFSDDP